MADARETQFQQDIISALAANGWLVGKADGYDAESALYPEDVLAYFRDAHPDQWEKFSRMYPVDTDTALLKSVTRQLDKDGVLSALRHGYKDRGTLIRLCRFRPDHGLNEETLRQYGLNRLRVVPEVTYSPHGYGGRLDLVLFVNGLPVATMELKSEFKQPVENAIRQYKRQRPPKDPTTRKPEPLLGFLRGALVHFAVSQHEVWMCTKLDGDDSFFLPFNKGTQDGGAGNSPHPAGGYDTAYLWEEVLLPDNLLQILGRFLHLQVEDKEKWDGTRYRKKTLIFPRFHQWDAVTRLIRTARQEGTGNKYLVQHSAGSGKSNSIAWTAHQLASLYNDTDEKIFDSVIVVTDRTVLDDQLQDTIYQFEHADGMVCRIHRELANGSKSEQLASALERGARIIIVTIQTFPYVLEMLRERATLKGRSYAIIADEAHSSQTGKTSHKLREVLGVELTDEEEISSEDLLDATVRSRKPSEQISYFAFTATPKPKTLETFGRLPRPDLPLSKENLPQAFHIYSMRQAIEEGFILDVLENYTTFNMACRLTLEEGAPEQEVDTRRGASSIIKWLKLHDYNIGQKVRTILEHFRTRVAPTLNGHAKAMVVTDSRKAAVRYKIAFDNYIAANLDTCEGISAMVAFSGEVVDRKNGPDPFTETSMNPGLKSRDMRTAFDTDEYQVMIVANKFQTGFDQPKLCAMYVDKRLKDVDAVQTLSRLNRTYPGKSQTFVLDFVNKAEDILAAFQPFYQTAELADVSDPNLAYDLKTKLDAQRIYAWSEVEGFVKVFFDAKAGQDALMSHCRPALDRYTARYRDAEEVTVQAEQALQTAKATGDAIQIKNAEHSLKEARKAKDALIIFKKDLRSFIRFYEFCSQIIDYDDRDLEALSIYARHLLPLLREKRDDEVDLSDLVLTHYRLSRQQEEHLRLKKDADAKLQPTSSIGTRTADNRERESLMEIIARMNELFAGDFSEGDALNYARTIADKLRENATVMEQVRSNTPDRALIGDFPDAVQNAVIESMDTHKDLAMQFLKNERTRKGFARLLLDMLLEGFKERAS